MRSLVVALVTSGMILALAPAAEAVTITFDEFGNVSTVGPVIDDEYAALGVLFSSMSGNNNVVTTQANYNSTKPNFICTYSGQILCEGETILDFTSPVHNLTFDAMGIEDVDADIAHIDVFTNGVFAAMVILPGNDEGLDPRLVDLSAFSDITRIRIHSITDSGGIGWDTFNFDTGGTTAVPEPATLLLVGAGLVAAVRRHRAKRA